MTDYPYWRRQTKAKPLYPDLTWNIPEQKQGIITIIGGHAGAFATALKTSEYLLQNYPLKDVRLLLPDSLQKHLPPLSNVTFAPSSPAGSFAPSPLLADTIAGAEFSLLIGDFSKNSAAELAISEALSTLAQTTLAQNSPNPQKPSDSPQNPLVLTRDAVDLAISGAGDLIALDRLTLVATLAQLQKLLRALYYPKVLLLSSPLPQILEVLHKFTLSYPTTILTFHSDQLIVAHQGQITTTPLKETSLTPLTLWNGQLAARVSALELYNPTNPLSATTAAIFN